MEEGFTGVDHIHKRKEQAKLSVPRHGSGIESEDGHQDICRSRVVFSVKTTRNNKAFSRCHVVRTGNFFILTFPTVIDTARQVGK